MVHSTCAVALWSPLNDQLMLTVQNGEDAWMDDDHRRFIMNLLLPVSNLLSSIRYFNVLCDITRFRVL